MPCCGKYETCSHACTPRGKWLGRREAESERAEPVRRLSDYYIWKNDVIMAANADIGLPMADLMRLVLAIEAAQTATPKGDAA